MQNRQRLAGQMVLDSHGVISRQTINAAGWPVCPAALENQSNAAQELCLSLTKHFDKQSAMKQNGIHGRGRDQSAEATDRIR